MVFYPRKGYGPAKKYRNQRGSKHQGSSGNGGTSPFHTRAKKPALVNPTGFADFNPVIPHFLDLGTAISAKTVLINLLTDDNIEPMPALMAGKNNGNNMSITKLPAADHRSLFDGDVPVEERYIARTGYKAAMLQGLGYTGDLLAWRHAPNQKGITNYPVLNWAHFHDTAWTTMDVQIVHVGNAQHLTFHYTKCDTKGRPLVKAVAYRDRKTGDDPARLVMYEECKYDATGARQPLVEYGLFATNADETTTELYAQLVTYDPKTGVAYAPREARL